MATGSAEVKQMQDLIVQARELRHRWETVYAHTASSPAAWQRQIPSALADAIEESLCNTETWLKQSQVKSCSSPGHLIGKHMAAVFLPQLLATMSELEAGHFGQLHYFVDGLTDLQTTILSANAHFQDDDPKPGEE